jgi:hypothetical protein
MTKGLTHMKKLLAAGAAFCALAFAQGAFAANTATIAVTHTPMVLSGSGSTTIHVAIPQATDPMAAINIFVPSGYTVNTTQSAGTTIGDVDSTAFSRDAGLTLPLSGKVTVDNPASHTSDSQACAGTPNSQAVWILNLSVAGQAIQLPLYLNPTVGAQTALGKYRLTICLPPPDVPVGTPGRSAQGAQVLDARFTVSNVFTTPLTPAAQVWETLFTPYTPNTGRPNALGTFEARAIVPVPAVVSLAKSYTAKTNSWKVAGKVTEGGEPVAGATVRVARGNAQAVLPKSTTARTSSTGTYVASGKLVPRKTTFFRASVTVPERPNAAGCATPLPAAVAPQGCVSATMSGWSAQSAVAKLTPPKLKKKH